MNQYHYRTTVVSLLPLVGREEVFLNLMALNRHNQVVLKSIFILDVAEK